MLLIRNANKIYGHLLNICHTILLKVLFCLGLRACLQYSGYCRYCNIVITILMFSCPFCVLKVMYLLYFYFSFHIKKLSFSYSLSVSNDTTLAPEDLPTISSTDMVSDLIFQTTCTVCSVYGLLCGLHLAKLIITAHRGNKQNVSFKLAFHSL